MALKTAQKIEPLRIQEIPNIKMKYLMNCIGCGFVGLILILTGSIVYMDFKGDTFELLFTLLGVLTSLGFLIYMSINELWKNKAKGEKRTPR